MFLHLNINKWGITLDLDTSSGRGLLLDRVARADVIVELCPGYLAERLAY